MRSFRAGTAGAGAPIGISGDPCGKSAAFGPHQMSALGKTVRLVHPLLIDLLSK